MMARIRILAAAATVLVCAWLGVSRWTTDAPDMGAFAQTVNQIDKAKTITWKRMFYIRSSSEDGKNTWAHSEVVDCAYKAPGLYREVRRDKSGKVLSVKITDRIHGWELRGDSGNGIQNSTSALMVMYAGPGTGRRDRGLAACP